MSFELREVKNQLVEVSKDNDVGWDTPSDVIRNYKMEALQSAKLSLLNQATHLRDFSSANFCHDSANVDKIKKMIRNILREVNDLPCANIDYVYQMTVQFFSLTEPVLPQ
jgi:hypothetical protein